MKNSVKPPKHLSREGKKWWLEIQNEFSIDDSGGLSILTAAAEAFDRMTAARKLIDLEGLTVFDRFQQKKVHPAVIIERDARGQMLQALRDLRLDVEPLNHNVGRPSGSGNTTFRGEM